MYRLRLASVTLRERYDLVVATAKFRGFTAEQQLKVVKYLVQITWGGTMALLYIIFHLYIDGLISSECTEISTTLLPPGESAASMGYCLAK